MTKHPESLPTEDTRLSATVVARRCACRGWIVAPEKVSDDTAERVVVHQMDEPHRSWDREAWIEANTTTVPVKVNLRRVA